MNRGTLRQQLFRRKPASALMADAEATAGGLKRALGALDLTLLGIGAIVKLSLAMVIDLSYKGCALLCSATLMPMLQQCK